jgi:RHS repeat-associated protein
MTNYSLAGEVTSVVNGRGKTNSLTLDRLGRTTTLSYLKADGLTAGSLTFGYDAAGNQTSFGDVAATTVTLDNAGRVTGVGVPGGGAANCVTPPVGAAQTCYAYFRDGAVKSVTDATGQTVFTEDQLGRPASVADPLETGTTTYTIDAMGRMTQRSEASGILTAATYSGIDQLNSKTETKTSQFASWTNSYDFAGNRTQEVSVLPGDGFAGTATFGYDTVQRLSSATQPTQAALTYGYDPASNRNSVSGGSAPRGSTSFAYLVNNALNTETPTGQAAISYAPDADGNITRDASGRYLRFDSLSRLESVYDSTNTTLLGSYTYDALGRLASRTASGVTTTFVYRGLTGQTVQTLAGGVANASVAWDTRGRPLVIQTGGSTYNLLTNPHGDVVGLATGSGTIAGWAHYDAWGQVLGSAGTQISFGYQTGYTDPLTGQVRMGVRWYDPRQGRFVSSDPAAGVGPLTNPLARQRWLYAYDSPLRYVDPTGLVQQEDNSGGCYPSCQETVTNSGASAPKQQASAPKPQGFDWSPSAIVQNGMVALGRALPQPVRNVYVRQIRYAGLMIGGATDRITNDTSGLIGYLGDTVADQAAYVGSVVRGDWSTANAAQNRNAQRQAQAAMAIAQGTSQLNPPAIAVNAAKYAANFVSTWRTNGMDAAMDKFAYDFGYQVIGGGAEQALITGLTMGAGRGFIGVPRGAVTARAFAPEGAGGAGDIFVIGKQADTAAYIGKPGFNVLNMPKEEWSLANNDAWVQGGMDRGAPFMPASKPNPATVFNPSRGELSVFGRELRQLFNGGYDIQGAQQGELLWPGQDWAAAAGQ